MAGFLYYLPTNAKSISVDELRAAGLDYAFDAGSRSLGRCPINANAPDGRTGIVVRGGPDAGRVGVYPDQTWKQIPGLEVWAGIDNENRPTPEDLARPDQLGGHEVTLGDDNRWLCPVARGAAEQDGGLAWYYAVPRVSTLDEAGEWQEGPVVARYAPLWDLATRWYDTRWAAIEKAEGDVAEFTFAGLHMAAVDALGANYAVGPVECDLLGLLSRDACVTILDALVDAPGIAEALKKILVPPGGSDSDAGRPDDGPDTDPQ